MFVVLWISLRLLYQSIFCDGQLHVQGRLAIPQDYLERFDAAGLLSDARKSLLGFVPQSASEDDDP